jgi:hypothetical protein
MTTANTTAESLKAALTLFETIQTSPRMHIRALAEKAAPLMSRNDFEWLLGSFIKHGSARRDGDYIEFFID